MKTEQQQNKTHTKDTLTQRHRLQTYLQIYRYTAYILSVQCIFYGSVFSTHIDFRLFVFEWNLFEHRLHDICKCGFCTPITRIWLIQCAQDLLTFFW